MRAERNRLPAEHSGGLQACRDFAVKAGADITAIECLAPHTFILECDEAGPPIYRHAGRAIQDFIGSNPQGEAFYDYWDTKAHRALESHFDVSAESHLAFRLFSISPGSKTGVVEFETTLIPVTAAGARKRRFVGISLMRAGRPARGESHNHLQYLQYIAFLDDGPAGRTRAPHLVRTGHS